MAARLGATESNPSHTVPVRERILDVGKGKMRVLTAGNPSAPPVLLLHGATFRAELWQETGTMAAVALAGFHAVATDLPGHGKYVITGYTKDEIMWRLIENMGLHRPVVMGHSLGGAYALAIIRDHSDALAGAVLVAPTKISRYAKRLKDNPLPVLVLWGDSDRMIPARKAGTLITLFPNSTLVLLEGARHECYQQQPNRFHASILDFLRTLRHRSVP